MLDDAEGIARVHVETWRATYPGQVPDSVLAAITEEKRAQMWRGILSRDTQDYRCYVAVAGSEHGEVVGFADGGPARPGVEGFGGEIFAIYLLPAMQGKGIGKRLLLELAAEMVDLGFVDAYLWVLATNTPARRFYEAMGGHEVARQSLTMGGAEVEEVAYGWSDLAQLASV